LIVDQWLISGGIDLDSWDEVTTQRFSECKNNSNPFDWVAKKTLAKHVNEWRARYRKQLPLRDPGISEFTIRKLKMKTPYAISLCPGTLDVPFCTDPHDPTNLITGFLKRLAPIMPEAQPQDLKKMSGIVMKWLEHHHQPLPFIPLCEDYLEQWLLTTSYNINRKEQLRKAFSYSVHRGFYFADLTNWDYRCKSFVKREFYEVAKFLRFINSRTDKFKSIVGPYIHAIEKRIFTSKHFVKGTDITTLPSKLIRLEKYKHILETDYSSYEAGFSPEYTDAVECNLWRYFLKNNPLILDIVMRTYYTHKGSKLIPRVEKIRSYEYRAKVVGTRMSGEMWTSLANSFSNYMNIKYLARKHHIKWDGFIEGDDGIFGLDDNTIDKKDYEDLGFNIKMKYEPSLLNTSFCGNIFDPIELKFLVPPEQICRLFWTCSSQYLTARRTKLNELLRMKAMSLFCLGKDTPIVSPLCLKILEIIGPGGLVQETGNKWWEDHMLSIIHDTKFKPVKISDKSRLLYQHLFGISLTLQNLIEEQISKMKSLEDVSIPYRFMSIDYSSGVGLLND